MGAHQVDVALGDLEQHELQRLGLRRRRHVLAACGARHGAGRGSAGAGSAPRTGSWRSRSAGADGAGRDRERPRRIRMRRGGAASPVVEPETERTGKEGAGKDSGAGSGSARSGLVRARGRLARGLSDPTASSLVSQTWGPRRYCLRFGFPSRPTGELFFVF